MTLSEAIASGFLDHIECELHDPNSSKTLSLLEAYDKGLLITVEDPSVRIPPAKPKRDANINLPLNTTNDASTAKKKVVAEEKVAAPVSAAKLTLQAKTEVKKKPENAVKKEESNVQLRQPTVQPMVKSQSFPHESRDKTTKSGAGNAPNSLNANINLTSTNGNGRQVAASTNDLVSKMRAASQANANTLTGANSASNNATKARSTSSSFFDLKSLDRLSTTRSKSSRSFIGKLRTKLTGARKMKSNVFDELLIIKSARIVDTKQSGNLTLEDAAERGLLLAESRIKDRRADRSLGVNEALEKGVLKFFHPINNFEFKYGQSCYIFSDSYLFLVNYVLDPQDKARKIGLKSAFNKFVIDKDNSVYFVKKGPPLALIDAIAKGLISCEVVDLQLMDTILATYYARSMQRQRSATGGQRTRTVENEEQKIDMEDEDGPPILISDETTTTTAADLVKKSKPQTSSTPMEGSKLDFEQLNEKVEEQAYGTNNQNNDNQLVNR